MTTAREKENKFEKVINVVIFALLMSQSELKGA